MVAFRLSGPRKVATAAIFALSSILPQVAANLASTSTLSPVPSWTLKSAMYMTLSNNDDYEYSIIPLTTAEGLNQSAEFRENTNFSGPITIVNGSNFDTYESSSTGITYLSCDSTTDGPDPSTLLNNIMDSKPLAIIMYTLGNGICSLSGSNLSYTRIFTVANGGFAHNAELMISSAKNTVTAQVSGKSTVTDNDTTDTTTTTKSKSKGHATSIAMGLLYGVTALISVTFLIIVATGAVRAHRFPERYGPGISWGDRPRQGRARGLARAVLDTMPVIKFGEPEPSRKPDPEHDLESGSMVEIPPAAVVRETSQMHEVQRSVSGEPATSAQPPKNNESSEDLGCSICTEDFRVGEDVRVLSCSHKFHPACIDPWLMDISSTCPLCRTDFNSIGNDDDCGTNDGHRAHSSTGEPDDGHPTSSMQRALQDLQRMRPTWSREECVRRISRVRRLTPFSARHRSRHVAAAAAGGDDSSTERNGADVEQAGEEASGNQQPLGSVAEDTGDAEASQQGRRGRLLERMRISRENNGERQSPV